MGRLRVPLVFFLFAEVASVIVNIALDPNAVQVIVWRSQVYIETNRKKPWCELASELFGLFPKFFGHSDQLAEHIGLDCLHSPGVAYDLRHLKSATQFSDSDQHGRESKPRQVREQRSKSPPSQ